MMLQLSMDAPISEWRFDQIRGSLCLTRESAVRALPSAVIAARQCLETILRCSKMLCARIDPKFLKTRCKHNDTLNVNLGYDFVTDMLVLEFALDRQRLDISPSRNSWLNRAGQSLAEALRLAACQELDIEFTELVTGYRVRQNRNGDFVDIYLYDSLSSGAGYALALNPLFASYLPKLENFSKVVPVTALATGA